MGNHDAKRAALALDLLLILISGAPSNHAGRNSTVIWGPPKSLADYGHTEPRRGAEWWGEDLLVTFGWAGIPVLPKVTRCQSGTLSGRYRRNGYVHNPIVLTVRPPSRASPLPQFDRGVSGRYASAGRPSSQASQLPH